jgi:hypothetical protein
VQKREDEKVIVTTSRGQRVECLPVLAMLEAIRMEEEEKIPPPVTYTVTDVTGDTQEREHDAESIQDKRTTDEERAAWHERQEVIAEIEGRINERTLKVIGTKGIRMLDMPPDEEWIEEHAFLGFDVPKTKIARLYHYFTTEVIGTPQDGLDIMAGIARVTGADEEVVGTIEDRFRTEMEKPQGEDAQGDQGDTAQGE